jgi:uncharacterized membrane protein (UPF0127 family)
MITVINQTRSLETPLRAKWCETFFCRLRGLTFRSSLEPDEGLLLVQKSESLANAAIHMFFVGLDLGVIWLNKEGVVVDIQLAKSWAPFYRPAKPACFILEISPQRLPEFTLGDKLSFE